MKLHRSIVAAAALALAAASAALASGTGGNATRTIRATAIGTGITLVDADHSGKPSIGDYEIGRQVFVNAAGKRLGHGSIFCVQVDASGLHYQCQSQLHYAGGDIFTAGTFSVLSPTFTEAIVGGTRAYAGISGTLAGTWLDRKFARARTVLSFHS